MNERIKELWFNAKGYYRSGNQHEWPVYVIDNPQQFADLIIQECVNTVLKEAGWYWNKQEFESSSAIHNAARRVQEHFGMKGVNNEPEV